MGFCHSATARIWIYSHLLALNNVPQETYRTNMGKYEFKFFFVFQEPLEGCVLGDYGRIIKYYLGK